MFFRLLLESFRRQRRRKLLAGAAILLGTTAVTAMLALATTIGDRIHRELAVYGANIVMTPEADALAVKIGGVDLKPATGNAYLHESDLQKLRGIFWANNITAVSPELPLRPLLPVLGISMTSGVPATAYWFNHDLAGLKTGAPVLHPWWKVQGQWPSEKSLTLPVDLRTLNIAIGTKLSKRFGIHVGDQFPLAFGNADFDPKATVVGIIETGDGLENQLFLNLSDAHRLGDNASPSIVSAAPPSSDAVSRVEISARTRPEDAFARKDPDTLSPKQRDLWYCRPYANSIVYQIHEAIPTARVEQVRRVEQSEGTVLNRISGLMSLIAAAALLAAGFAVSAAMATAILERRREIGLMRSLGASRGSIALLFYVESATLALIAGTGGYLLGSLLSAWLGARIFSTGGPGPASLNPVLLPVVLALALVVAVAGSAPSVRSALRLDPSHVLRADA